MNLLSVINLKKTYGVKTLFEEISFNIEDSDKIGVIGINGTGKTSMLRIVAGQDSPDAGEIRVYGAKRIEYLAQTPELDPCATVLAQVFRADTPEMNTLRDYESTLDLLARYPEDEKLQKHLLGLTDTIDAAGLWNLKSQVETILTQLGIKDFDKTIGALSGGQRKRVAMASVLLTPCDLLILDEPTNHLDNETITWLEKYLENRRGALLMVTHDRYFLDRVVNKTMELDGGKLYEYTGNYSEFVEKKAARKEFESVMEQKRQNLYRRELAWIRRGARARTTKQKARIQRFEDIKNSAADLGEDFLEINVGFTRLGKQVVDMDHVSKAFKGQCVVKDFSFIFDPDERVGIIGKNGRGKSTLLNLIAGKIRPDSGSIVIGDTVKIGYFSQESEDMDLSLRAIEYIREGAETVENARGEVITAAQMMELFLFDRTAQWIRISELSGGERRRLYLLRILMSAPNVLLLDEPTNDLDIDTLKILENYLDDFQGSVLTVSHDRYFLDRVCDTIFSFTGGGEILVQTGNFTDYMAKHAGKDNEPASNKPSEAKTEKVRSKTIRLSYREQQEYDHIDTEMEALEIRLEEIDREMAGITTDYTRLQALSEEKDQSEETLLEKMERKEYLEGIKNAGKAVSS
ncbi:ABC-F family ATP-binding cassette domain-containing protein [Eubacterium sp. 1001713B170207_170306_E7]|uniref:ABC-F family ATP-binding cassette domain-containing protein n=1 Tax=Eubacterium sp. 1001713B170207_170306_E7 TaxID=2787097 RepID=UPI00189B1971|nr:ABC-F family ATP-binding cassette domain-containing protein [Eubacterium sp. 1001713B170207_170306_E7]